MKLIHLTDPHFVPPGQTLYGRDPSVALKRCLADINEHHADADLCVITGDLTHWGEPEAFGHLRECLSVLNMPLQLLVGNHDSRAEFVRWFPDQDLDDHGFVQTGKDYKAGRFLFLDTTEPGCAEGWYCDLRLAWLEAQLADANGRDVYLFMHHPPFNIGIPTLDRIALVQQAAFAAVVRPHSDNIKHLFFGHIHRPLCGHWLGISMSSLRGMNHQVGLDFKTTASLPGNFEAPAYAIVLFEPDRLIVHTHDFLDDSPKFDLANSPVQDWAVRKPHT